jgi:hypothetical protein
MNSATWSSGQISAAPFHVVPAAGSWYSHRARMPPDASEKYAVYWQCRSMLPAAFSERSHSLTASAIC